MGDVPEKQMHLKPRASLAVREVEGEVVVFDRTGGRVPLNTLNLLEPNSDA